MKVYVRMHLVTLPARCSSVSAALLNIEHEGIPRHSREMTYAVRQENPTEESDVTRRSNQGRKRLHRKDWCPSKLKEAGEKTTLVSVADPGAARGVRTSCRTKHSQFHAVVWEI